MARKLWDEAGTTAWEQYSPPESRCNGRRSVNWRQSVSDGYKRQPHDPGVKSKPKFYSASSPDAIIQAEKQLDVELPSSLRSLLLETNGVMDTLAVDGGEWFENMWLVWPVEEIISTNLSVRSEQARGTYDSKFRNLLFFAGAGCDGVLFAHRILRDRIATPTVVVWHPIEDRLTEVALSLEEFIEGWLTNGISV